MTVIMVCIKCGRRNEKIELAHLPGKVCEECFKKIVEKRVRRDVRAQGWLQSTKRVIILDDGTANAAVCRYFVGELAKHFQIELVSRKISSVNDISQTKIIKLIMERKADIAILPWNVEQESEYLLKNMVSNKGFVRDDKRIVKLLRHVSREEVEIFANLLGLKFVKKSGSYDPKIAGFLGGLEKKSPDIRFALISAFEKL